MVRTPLENLSLEKNFAAYRPSGEFSFSQTVEMIDDTLAYCRDYGIGRLLVDIRGVTGFPPPSTYERFTFATKWAETAAGTVRLAMVAAEDMIDADKIGVTMARNRGLETDAFTDENKAVDWLLDS